MHEQSMSCSHHASLFVLTHHADNNAPTTNAQEMTSQRGDLESCPAGCDPFLNRLQNDGPLVHGGQPVIGRVQQTNTIQCTGRLLEETSDGTVATEEIRGWGWRSGGRRSRGDRLSRTLQKTTQQAADRVPSHACAPTATPTQPSSSRCRQSPLGEPPARALKAFAWPRERLVPPLHLGALDSPNRTPPAMRVPYRAFAPDTGWAHVACSGRDNARCTRASMGSRETRRRGGIVGCERDQNGWGQSVHHCCCTAD